MKMGSGQVHRAAGRLSAIAGQVHTHVYEMGWFSYGGAAKIVLAAVLVAVAAAVVGLGFRLRTPLRIPTPGRTARTLMLASWGLAIIVCLVCLVIYARTLIHSRPSQPMFPVTTACIIVLFLSIQHMGHCP